MREDPDELRVVIALGVLAGMLALVQTWVSTQRSLFDGTVPYPAWGSLYQDYLFDAALFAFVLYLLLMLLAVNMEAIGRPREGQSRWRGVARKELWLGLLSIVALLLFVAVRVLSAVS